MGNCFRPFGLIRRCSSRFSHKKIVLLLVGLDNAGKTCTAKSLSKDSVENVIPTVGFNVVKLYHKGYTIIIYDLGGGAQIRDIWTRYFADVHGVIFVVDASDRERLDECKKVFEELLVNETLAGKPVLVLANKQDRAGALDELDIVEKLNVESIVNMQHCPTLVETCSATVPTENGKRRKLDPGIENGYRWLLRRIIKDYDLLNRRVMADQEVQKLAIAKERAEQKKKIEMRKETGDSSYEESENEEEQVASHTNPFQPIQVLVKEIENKELSKQSVASKPNSNKNTDEVIDLEEYSKNGENGETGSAAIDGVREQLRQKSAGQRKKRQLIRKNNRTAPTDEAVQQANESPSVTSEIKHLNALPPIRHKGSTALPWAQVANGKPQNGFAWELEKSLEVVLPPPVPNGRPPSSVGSDADDVITALR